MAYKKKTDRPPKITWTVDMLAVEARKYKTRPQFKAANSRAYYAVVAQGLLDAEWMPKRLRPPRAGVAYRTARQLATPRRGINADAMVWFWQIAPSEQPA